MTTTLRAIDFTPPLVAPANPHGLDAATTWADSLDGEALRWLPAGVQFRLRTHRASSAFGSWGASWCADPNDLDPEDDVKTGPPFVDDDPDPFAPFSTFAFDRLQECGNLSEFDRREVHERAEQTFQVKEPIAVETEFSTRLVTDAGTPEIVDDLISAVGHLEETFAATGATGLVHARVGLLALAQNLRLTVRDPATPGVLRTPAGHRWVFGGGYATPLGDTLIATSPTYGWRGPIGVREAIQYERNQFVVIAERSLVVGYETVIGAAEITP
ncbi:MAG: hypothetical protein HYZ38_04970 [Mycobacterium sp.]|nr:hypothetical protein [Mycobacterium sp.]